MNYNNNTYRNLQNQVWYLTNYLENEAQLVELGIKVVGVQASLPIPEGTYEYGDAYMIGEAAPFTMYVWTRANESHPEDYWFEVGPFPLPGPAGPKGDGIETVTNISLTHDIDSGDVYGDYNGQTYHGISTIQYKDSTTGETKSQKVYTSVFLPIVGSGYINIDTDPTNNRFVVRLNDTALALDYWKIQKTPVNTAPLWVAAIGAPDYAAVTSDPTPGSFAYRDSNGDCKFRKIILSQEGFVINGNNFDQTVMIYGLKNDINIHDQNGGTLTANEAYVINQVNVCRPTIQGRTYTRVSKFGEKPARFMSCDSTGTIYVLTCDTTNKTYTITASQETPTYKHVTQMHVVIPGDDDYYLTIFNTDNHGAMYNSGSASTLLDNIGTAGTMAYKQNTANAAYIPVHVQKNASGNWAWNMGSASGTFTTAQIDTIIDDYETLG